MTQADFTQEFGYNMHSIETDDTLFQILNANSALRNELRGGIYVWERPDDSKKEDIVINNLFINHDAPQTGISNVNIHVPDVARVINGKQQFKADRERLRVLTTHTIAALKAAHIIGLAIRITNETILKEPNIKEHYNNIRIEWNIHKITTY